MHAEDEDNYLDAIKKPASNCCFALPDMGFKVGHAD
jgi:hypothetical protein